MRIVLFCHSLVSDWNHGNAHFLRGIARELVRRGHQVRAYEPADGWSRTNLLAQEGRAALAAFRRSYPELSVRQYRLSRLDLDEALDAADLVLVHEWNDPALVAALGRRRAAGGRFRLLFHDTHHRAATDPAAMAAYDLSAYDGVLAFGAAVREIYRQRGWARRVWVWHEAADLTVFRPLPALGERDDLVWIGNWGDGERARALEAFLLRPIERLRLTATIYGVRYPAEALRRIARAGARYGGWIANTAVPRCFAAAAATVHVPRRPYRRHLPGIPTIRVFEALACGIPLVSAPWDDVEGLFRAGEDYLVARDGAAMTRALRALLADRDMADALRRNGLAAVRARHSCAHRVDELLAIGRTLGLGERRGAPACEVA